MGKKVKGQVPVWTLGDRMRKARETAGIGVGAMAALLTRDRNTITNYEKNKTRPPRTVLDRWAQITGISLDWIIGDASPFGWRATPPGRSALLTSNTTVAAITGRDDGSVTSWYTPAAA